MQALKQELDLIHRLHATAGDYGKTLALLRALKAGTVTLDQVMLTDGGWQLVDVQLDMTPQPADDLSDELKKRNGSLETLEKGNGS